MHAPKFDPFDQYYTDELGCQQPKPWCPHYFSYTRGQAHRCSADKAPLDGNFFRNERIGYDVPFDRVVDVLKEVLELRRIPAAGRIRRGGGNTGSLGTIWNAAIGCCWDDAFDREELRDIARVMGDDMMPLHTVQSRLIGIRLDVAKRLGFDGFFTEAMPFHRDYGFVF